MFCPECGHKNKDENKFCIGCGKLLEQGKPNVRFADVSTPTVTVEKDNTETLLKRMFVFLEDGNWQKADEYCEKVLDLDPECAQAYLGKMMVEMKIRKKSDISKSEFYGKSVNYSKMVKYADYNFKNEIMSFNKCWLYNWAESIRIHSKSENEFLKAEAIFLYLDDFLDSKNKAYQCQKHYTCEIEPGVCPDCGYHNNSSSSRCIKCGKQLNEDTQTSQTNSYSQISDNISSEIKSSAQSVNSNHENNFLSKGNEQNQSFYQNNNFYEANSYMTSKKQIYTKDAQIKRIVIGIVAIVVSPIIMIMSSTAGVLGAILSVNTIAGITGFLASIFLLTGGIISIAARKNKIGAITSSAFLCAAAAISFLGTGVYTNWNISFFDLRTWSYVAFILASTAVGTLVEKECPEEKKQCIENWVLESILGVVLVIIIIATIKG